MNVDGTIWQVGEPQLSQESDTIEYDPALGHLHLLHCQDPTLRLQALSSGKWTHPSESACSLGAFISVPSYSKCSNFLDLWQIKF